MSQWHLAPPFVPRVSAPMQHHSLALAATPQHPEASSCAVEQAQQPDDVQQQQQTSNSTVVVPQRPGLSLDAAPWYPRGREPRPEQVTEQQATSQSPAEQQPEQFVQLTERRTRWRLSSLPNLLDVLRATDATEAARLLEMAEQDEQDLDAMQLGQHQPDRMHIPIFDRLTVISGWDELLSRMTLQMSEEEDEFDDEFEDDFGNEEEHHFGLTSDEISRLRSYRFQPTAANDDRDRCSCCLAEFEAEQMLRVLPCKHEFHSACVDRWLGENRSCPLCRNNAA